ncbi:RICIN domain-containing protein [Chitinophaga sp. GbtcB8]|uniref:RICIN domain-containing protein n=1 Tax=Chitinophaga sp. GbtcB8 TaxID=2824753 RepID=UPI001C301061|nr:RICIN domain-containing protein [Chitinophaga sp. GbtcB8]
MKNSRALKPRQWLLIMLCITVFFSHCVKDEQKPAPTPAAPKTESTNSNPLARGGIDPGIDDQVYDGWLRAYLIRSGGQTYFCNSLTDRSRAFMWGQAYMITGVEDFYDKSQRADAKQLIIDLLNTFIANEITPAATKDLSWDSWNDDIEWAIIALIRGYQITGNTAYRDAAITNWNVVYNRGWNNVYDGGIWENMEDVPNGGKIALSNYPFIIAGCMIYNATGNTDVLNKCIATYAWARRLLNTTTGRLYEGWGPNGLNVASDDNIYNSGLFVNAANALYQITRTASYLDDAKFAAAHVINAWPILNQDKPANGDFGADQFVRGLSLMASQNNLWGTYREYLTKQCLAAWSWRRYDYNVSWNIWSAATPTGDVRAMEAEGSVVLQAVTPSESYEPVADGTYRIVNRNSGKVLDCRDGNTANGTIVQQYTWNGTNAQRWTITGLGNGQYKIINVGSGRALDLKDVSTEPAAIVHIWDYVGWNNQKVSITSPENGYYTLSFVHSGKVLDVLSGSTDERASIIQYGYHGGNSEQWQLIRL